MKFLEWWSNLSPDGALGFGLLLLVAIFMVGSVVFEAMRLIAAHYGG